MVLNHTVIYRTLMRHSRAKQFSYLNCDIGPSGSHIIVRDLSNWAIASSVDVRFPVSLPLESFSHREKMGREALYSGLPLGRF